MRTEIVNVTPELAKLWLEKNDCNRTLTEKGITEWAQKMRLRDWQSTHQGMAFYIGGSLADGQHRLHAIIRNNLAVKFMVTYDLEKSCAMAIDIGRKRSLIDGITIGGIGDWIVARHTQMVPVISYPKKLTDKDKIDFILAMKQHLEFATQTFVTNRRNLTPSVIHAAIAMAHFHGESESKLRRFCEVLLDGAMADPSERIIISIRDYFMNHTNNGSTDKNEKYLRLQRAIQAYCKNESTKRAAQPKDYIYSADGLF